MAGELRCPHCKSVVVPVRDAAGGLLCPLCANTGVVQPQAPFSQPPAPAYAAPDPAPGTYAAAPLVPPKAPGKAVAALVLGICGFIPYVGLVCSIIAIVLGVQARRFLRANPGQPGDGMALAGIIVGAISLGLMLIIVLSAVVFVLVSNLSADPAAPAP